MSLVQRLVLLGVGLVLLAVTLELIRKRRLREEYAVLWVCTGLVLLVAVALPDLMFTVASWLKLAPVVLMAFLCLLLLAAIVLHYSVIISRHSDREKTLAQKLALLEDEVRKLRGESGEGPSQDEKDKA